MSKIVTDTIKLKKVVTDLPKNKSEEEVLSAALFTALEKEKGFGLSANQIGVDKRMCVINIKDPMVLVNPKKFGFFSFVLQKYKPYSNLH